MFPDNSKVKSPCFIPVLKLFNFLARGGSKSAPVWIGLKVINYTIACSWYVVSCDTTAYVTFTICTQCRFFVFDVPNKAFNKPRPGVDRMRKVFATAVWHPFYLLYIKGFFKDVNMAYQTNKLSSLGIFFCQILCQANNKFTSSCRTWSGSKIFESIVYFLARRIFLLSPRLWRKYVLPRS